MRSILVAARMKRVLLLLIASVTAAPIFAATTVTLGVEVEQNAKPDLYMAIAAANATGHSLKEQVGKIEKTGRCLGPNEIRSSPIDPSRLPRLPPDPAQKVKSNIQTNGLYRPASL